MAVRSQQPIQLPSERLLAMVSLLVSYVRDKPVFGALTHRKRRVSPLPREQSEVWECLVDPSARVGLQCVHETRERQLWSERNVEMHVVPHAADAKQQSTFPSRDGRQMAVQTLPPFRCDPGLPPLGGPYAMNANPDETVAGH